MELDAQQPVISRDAPVATPTQRAWSQRIAPAAFALAVALIYGGALPYPFVFDDILAINLNPSLPRGLLTALIAPPEGSPVTHRPLVNLSLALNYQLGGLAPAGYRLYSLALHLGNALLVWWLLVRLLRRPELPAWLRSRHAGVSFAIAMLWLCHPLQTEAVAYVTQRTELMAGGFMLLAVHAALSVFEGKEPRANSLLAGLACLLGAGCKETVASVLLLVFALDRALFSGWLRAAWQRHRLLYVSLLVGLVPVVVQTLIGAHEVSYGLDVGVSPIDSLALQGGAISWYLWQCVWPEQLSVSYNWAFDHALQRYVWADLVIGALFVLTCWSFVKRPFAALPAVAFFACLAPSSSVIPIISEPLAERRMYIALLSVLSYAVFGAWYLAQRAGERGARVAVALCALLAGSAATRSFVRVQDYRSPIAIWGAAVEVAPDNPQALLGLAGSYAEAHQPERAIPLYERIAAGSYPYKGPTSWGTRALMMEATVLAELGQREASARAVQRALHHDPNSAMCRLQHAAELASSGRIREAIASLEAMLSQPFLHPRVHAELSTLYAHLGDEQRARTHRAAAK